MNKKDIRKQGYNRGWSVASWQDMPEIGTKLPLDVDYQGIGTIETVSDQIDAWDMFCSATESNDRSYSPFEQTAHAINEQGDKADDFWQAFDDGIYAGINAYRRKHYPLKKMRQNAKI